MRRSLITLPLYLFPLQFTIKPLDKKIDVFKFNSSKLRVNKLVSLQTESFLLPAAVVCASSMRRCSFGASPLSGQGERADLAGP